MECGKLPVHVAVIMDGNGRWAKKRLLPRSAGHKAGMDKMVAMSRKARDMGIKYLTVYALSTENFSRPKEELDGLFTLFRKYFTKYAREIVDEGGAVGVIGDLSRLPEDLQKTITDSVALSPSDASFKTIIAINYGARAEIVRAVNKVAERNERVTEESFASYLYTGGVPYPDLIIRTGGEKRLSNFLVYQAAYAELYFTDVLFPDFTDKEFEKAINDYCGRNRRFGKI